MTRRLTISAVCSCLFAILVAWGLGPAVRAQPTPHSDCARLTLLKLPDVKVTEAVPVAAATTGAVRAAHCRVAGVIGTEIRFSLLLPDSWNRKFFMGGGGGFVGSVQNSAETTVNFGYATAGTDTGHQASGTAAGWALNNLERQVNFGYLAVHRTAEVAKAIIRGYFDSESSKNYFAGCSRGGGQAVMEAIRFPDDFDGIVAGAPALDWPGIGAQFVKDAQAAFPDPRNLTTPMFQQETLKGIEQQILDKCDALDGVRDGVIDDPRRCPINVDEISSVTDVQRAALKKIYGPTRSRDGEIYPGQPVGGEGEVAGWPLWITGVNQGLLTAQNAPSLRFAFGTELFKYIIYGDPAWDYSHYDFSTWKKDTALAASFLNATNPDLEAFKSKGHKLILWHGWADAALTPLGSIRYYDQVQARDPNRGDYFRMFLMPGVLHCGGGPGPDTADWTTAITDWVENGNAPGRVVARKVVNGTAVRTRPLCAYPQHAEYSGAGSTDDEKNFTCR
jgi:hypothetical protein